MIICLFVCLSACVSVCLLAWVLDFDCFDCNCCLSPPPSFSLYMALVLILGSTMLFPFPPCPHSCNNVRHSTTWSIAWFIRVLGLLSFVRFFLRQFAIVEMWCVVSVGLGKRELKTEQKKKRKEKEKNLFSGEQGTSLEDCSCVGRFLVSL